MFHPGSECHGENDPNGVMEFNGVYHLFMQDHNPMQLGGHFATRDFVHWRRLGIAIWNDRWYDKAAIWTFSATIGDRGPRIIYPGIAGVNASNGDCGHDSPGTGCFTHALAQPANYSDPWLVDWEKPAQLNPTVRITNGTGINSGSRDPTTAWKTSRGEWRYADAHADIYSSWDFETFHWAGNLENFGTGDCPDFFPLPPLCPACAAVPSGAEEGEPAGGGPTHVRAGGFKGVYVIGRYDEGPENSTGSWTPLPQFDPAPLDPEQPKGSPVLMDAQGPRTYYAAKSFWDARKGRRIAWAWVRLANQVLEYYASAEGDRWLGFKPGGCPGIGDVMTNTNSMPREITYDPQLQRLNYFPIPEMTALRGASLGGVPAGGAHLAAGKPLTLSTDAKVAQSELRASFAVPTKPTRLGVSVLSGSRLAANPAARQPAPADAQFSTVIFIDFVPSSGGEPGVWNVTAGYDQSSMLCPFYGSRFDPPPSLVNRTACPSRAAPLLLKASDSKLDFAVWTDHVFLEVFLMGGRQAWTVPLPCEAIGGGAGASAFASGSGAQLLSAEVWEVQDIQWDDSEEGPGNHA